MNPVDHSIATKPFSGNGTPRICAGDLERDARSALELRAGRTFGNQEWELMRRKLTEVYAILRDWENGRLKIGWPC